MNRSMIQATVTMGQLQNKLDLIGHNLSNVNTHGYKSKSADFSSLLYQQMDNLSHHKGQAGRLTPDGIRLGTGARLSHTNIDLSQGSLQNTGRELDVALLQDKHLFELRIPTENGTETQYTRAGNFYLNPMDDGRMMLTNSDGYPVIGESGNEILLENGFSELSIDKNGRILVTRDGEQTVEAQLNVVEAVRPRMLESVGDNRFRLPAEIALDGVLEDAARQDVQIQSQAIEASNVNISNQMTDMLMAQRAYQFNAKSITTSDQMMGLVNQLRT
ncbi:flagellar hook-basal body protein [Halobacillus sp. BBL2006]|uniref:flagellar hook-basal body protein n=1 Tax=Halobacillus sp. BBL2006 TaxID=1543706 RepID=UPI000543A55C|nr:flagellar hook-basal body protein [Halobacillus sp. BBL2006]KHE70002.1 flagellar hook-basal body protein [Halobacillus sp. BBL2006]